MEYNTEVSRLKSKLDRQINAANTTEALLKTLRDTPQATNAIIKPLEAKLRRQLDIIKTTQVTISILEGLQTKVKTK